MVLKIELGLDMILYFLELQKLNRHFFPLKNGGLVSILLITLTSSLKNLANLAFVFESAFFNIINEFEKMILQKCKFLNLKIYSML
jgi:hypothetical protein